MEKDIVEKLLPIFEAYQRGESIEHLWSEDDDWVKVNHLDIHDIVDHPESYRIKPKDVYRPFNSAKECFEEMQKHTNGTWFKSYLSSAYFQVVMVSELGITDGNGDYTTFEDAVHRYRFLDGSNFGIKVKD